MATARDVANRLPITVALLMGSLLVAVDTTIANVALPHMQGSFSSSQDQTAWVLTSYIVGAAIMTPLGGWLASRLGYKRVMLISIGGFTLASVACGSSTSLVGIVACRFLQGLCGASIQPLGQTVMLDLYPPSKIGQVMAVLGATIFLAPIAGPALGGWLTDNFSWRWVFYVNLPIGVISFAAIWLFLEQGPTPQPRRFDFLGYGALAVFIVCLQLMLDRGPTLDWFASTEIRAEAILALIGFYVFMVQTITSANPFFDRALVADRNFVIANLFSIVAGVMLFSTLALLPPLMQGLLGYSVLGAGLVMAPRGFGSLVSMLVVGRMVGRADYRLILFAGFSLVAGAMFQMTHYDLSMDSTPFIFAGILQGLGMGLIFMPMNALAFTSMSPRLRADGSIVFALLRTLAQSVGVSAGEAIFVNQQSVAHGDLAAAVQTASPTLAAALPAAMNPATSAGLISLNSEITRQAAMVGYIDVFRLGLIGALVSMPLILLLRPPKTAAAVTEVSLE
jgi:DHA2 family multidrug resistance protein